MGGFQQQTLSGLTQQVISGQNGAMVLIAIDSHALSGLHIRYVCIYVCFANTCIIFYGETSALYKLHIFFSIAKGFHGPRWCGRTCLFFSGFLWSLKNVLLKFVAFQCCHNFFW